MDEKNGELGRFVGATNAKLDEHSGKIKELWKAQNKMNEDVRSEFKSVKDEFRKSASEMKETVTDIRLMLAKGAGVVIVLVTVAQAALNHIMQ